MLWQSCFVHLTNIHKYSMEVLLLFSHSVVSDSMSPHGLQHTRLPGPSLSPGIAQTHVHVWMMPSSHLVLCHPLSPPALNSSQHQGRFNESALHIGGSKYWSFSFSISLFDEYSGLISFRTDWFDILVVQETLTDLQQHS